MKLYYGNETKKAMQAFDFSSRSVDKEFIYSITQIKKASCIANFKTGRIDKKMMSAILKVSDEILLGKLENNFKLKYLQGGAGTAINMNVNEVIAKKGTEILKNEINPNDHVNISQSTNDVNPSATKITLVNLNKKLIYSLDLLINSLDKKSKEFKNIKKLGRTHLQDAIPTTLGLEFSSYKEIVLSHKKNILNTSKNLYELNMGGTAIGDQTNADFKYKEYFYKELNKITKENFRPAKNLMSNMPAAVPVTLRF